MNKTPEDPADLRNRAESQLSERSGRSPRQLSLADARRLVHELEVHQIELELQNEELRGARLEVEALLARYTELFDFAPIGYALLDAAGLIVELNHSGARILGTYRSAVVGKPFARAVATEDLQTLQALLES